MTDHDDLCELERNRALVEEHIGYEKIEHNRWDPTVSEKIAGAVMLGWCEVSGAPICFCRKRARKGYQNAPRSV